VVLRQQPSHSVGGRRTTNRCTHFARVSEIQGFSVEVTEVTEVTEVQEVLNPRRVGGDGVDGPDHARGARPTRLSATPNITLGQLVSWFS
jgi:hypothetical protein